MYACCIYAKILGCHVCIKAVFKNSRYRDMTHEETWKDMRSNEKTQINMRRDIET